MDFRQSALRVKRVVICVKIASNSRSRMPRVATLILSAEFGGHRKGIKFERCDWDGSVGLEASGQGNARGPNRSSAVNNGLEGSEQGARGEAHAPAARAGCRGVEGAICGAE